MAGCVQGQRCSNQTCLCRLHDFCVDTFFRGQDARKCPLCRSEWTGRDFVGERAARGMASAPGRSSGARNSRGR
jgi:RING finger family protein